MLTQAEISADTAQLHEDINDKLKKIINGAATDPDVMVGEPVANIAVPTIAKVMSLITQFPVFGRSTQAVMYADGNFLPNMVVYVTNDPTPANNWFYLRTGAYGLTGAGQWTKAATNLFQTILDAAPAQDVERAQPHADFSFFTGRILYCPGPITVRRQTNGRYVISGGAVHNWDAEKAFDIKFASQLGPRDRDFLPKVGDMFVSWQNGNNANPGTSITTAKKTITAAYANITAAGGTVWVLNGYSHEQITVAKSTNVGGGLARPVKIKALYGPGTAIFIGYDSAPFELAWTLDSSDIYRATPAANGAIRLVILKDASGNTNPLPYYADLTALTAAGHHWGWTQNDTTHVVYVRLGGQDVNSQPVKDTLFFCYDDNGHNLLSTRTLIKDLDFLGSGPIRCALEVTGAETGSLYLQNIYKAWTSSAGVRNEGCETFAQDYYVDGTWFSDGFSYTVDAIDGHEAKGLEMNCVARRCGSQYTDQGSPSPPIPATQGSSMHSKGTIIRINSLYEQNFGQSAADAGEAVDGSGHLTRAWHVGCRFGDPWVYWDSADTTPQPIAGNAADISYVMISGMVWTDNCSYGGPIASYGFQLIGTPVGTAKGFRNSFQGAVGDKDGTVTPYTPAAP